MSDHLLPLLRLRTGDNMNRIRPWRSRFEKTLVNGVSLRNWLRALPIRWRLKILRYQRTKQPLRYVARRWRQIR